MPLYSKSWKPSNDGNGSGLDADLLDGYDTGTLGNTIPLLSTANTWSNNQIILLNLVGLALSITNTNATGSALYVTNTGTVGSVLDNTLLIRELASTSNGNTVKNRVHARRTAAGLDWNTIAIHDSIGVDSLFLTPGTDSRCWYERRPTSGEHSWGNAGTEFLVIGTGGLKHYGLNMSTATAGVIAVDQRYTFTTASIVLNATSWTDTGISGGAQLTGTPSIYMLHMQAGPNEWYTGVIPWFHNNGAATLNDEFSEIALTKTGDGGTITSIFCRIFRTANAAPKLQLLASATLAAYAYTLNFRRIW